MSVGDDGELDLVLGTGLLFVLLVAGVLIGTYLAGGWP